MAMDVELSPDGSMLAFVMRDEVFVCSGSQDDDQVMVVLHVTKNYDFQKSTVDYGRSWGLGSYHFATIWMLGLGFALVLCCCICT